MSLRFAVALIGLVALASCYSQQIDPMEAQPKLRPFAASRLFADASAMRSPPAGTVPMERTLDESAPTFNAADLALGREKFDIVCAACHGLVGDGDSVVATKMSLRPPPSLHEDRIRALTSDYLYAVIRDGYGLMPRYSDRLSVHERWQVVAYLRALQLSRHAPIAELPDDLRKQLEANP